MFFGFFIQQILSLRDDLENLYLLPPYVDGKGISKIANFYGDYSIMSHGTNQHIKLGYMSTNTSGVLVYRNQLNKDKFQIDFKLNIGNIDDGDNKTGLLIFFTKTDKVEIGPFYGINPSYEFAIALDLKDGLDVEVKIFVNQKMVKSTFFLFYENGDVTVRIRQEDKLQVEIKDEYDTIMVYDSSDFFISKDLFLGITAMNGENSQASFSIRSIEPSLLKVVPKIFARGEREGSSKLIWIVFLCSGGILSYYLYSKQSLKKD